MKSVSLLVVLTLMVAGCVAPSSTDDEALDANAAAPRAPHALADVFPWETTTDDGITLRGHVYLPEGAGPFATVLTFWPYWNAGGGFGSANLAAEAEDGRTTLRSEWGPIMDAGFAVAAISQRGTGDSTGCYSYMNHPANGPDANHVIEALAAEPWSTGAVGMYGLSYGAATQFSALAADPPAAFKAAVPVSGEWDEWNLLGRWGTSSYYAGAHAFVRSLEQGAGADGVIYAWDEGFWAPTPEHLCEQTFADAYEYQELWRTGDKSPFYEERDLREDLVNARVPTFATFGLWNSEGHILQSEGLWDLFTHEDRRMMLGQHGHAYTGGSADFGVEYAVPWFDHYLRGGPAPQRNIVDYQLNTGEWRQADAWPPVGTRTLAHLTGDTMTLNATQVTPGTRALTPRTVTWGADLGVDSSAACDAATGVTWTSPPLAEPIVIAGNWFLVTNITVTGADDATLLSTLLHGPADAPCATQVQVSNGDLRHRGGELPAGGPFPVGEKTPLALRSNPLAHVVPAGHRLMLATGLHPGFPNVEPNAPPIDVHLAPDGGSALVLNVVEGELRFE